MIKRLLVANRGEIALRIIRACRELDIETIAVFSDADRQAPHVAAADRAVALGPAPAAESYLSIPKLIAAARAQRADAVHPGYGFLSESAAFAAACEQAGLIFVGPPSDVIARMGSKIEARRLMTSAGVPVVPGETSDDQSDHGIEKAFARVGFPAVVKASAGGGGKGMREVRDWAEAVEAIQTARREATAAFADGTLYVERLIDRPRHVEVQIIADHHGAVTHLFERECSVQRRHQKVIEESPSPALTPALRARMTDAAVAAARAAGYRNAGTIEFLLEGHGDAATFYFLEMNTRLQVEHAVTEAVAGVDLVRAQLLVANIPSSASVPTFRFSSRFSITRGSVPARSTPGFWIASATPSCLRRMESFPCFCVKRSCESTAKPAWSPKPGPRSQGSILGRVSKAGARERRPFGDGHTNRQRDVPCRA
jgi:acetyl/propionyl-CoA carboxylase alpha subunit